MAKYRIELSDGNAYVIEAPDDMAPDDVRREAERMLTPAPAPVQQAPEPASGQTAAPPPAADVPVWVREPGNTQAVREAISALPEEQRGEALRQWADESVKREREYFGQVKEPVTGFGLSLNAPLDAVRNIARGTPLGSFTDELAGGATALFGGSYEEGKALEEARNRAAEENSVKLGELPYVGDVRGSGLLKLGGGLASAPFAPPVRLLQGTALLPSLINSAATGASYGALYGAGEGDSLEERGRNALTGAGVGTVLATGGQLAASGAGNIAGRVARGRAPQVEVPDPVTGEPVRVSPQALDRVLRAATDDDLLGGGPSRGDPAIPANYHTRANRLYVQGILADMGPNLRAQAAGVAGVPGEGRAILTDYLDSRAAGARGRITRSVNALLGPPRDIPEIVADLRQDYRTAAQPFRETFENNPVPYTPELEGIVNRLTESTFGRNVLERARNMADFDPNQGPNQFFAQANPDGTWTVTRVPNAREWDYIKRAFDDIGQSQTENDRRIGSTWASQIREAVDRALSPADPAQSPWALARAYEGEDFRLRDAITRGEEIFRRNLTPDELRAELTGGTSPAGAPRPSRITRTGRSGTGGLSYGDITPLERDAMRVGAREAVRREMDTAASAMEERGAEAARRLLNQHANTEKLRVLTERPRGVGALRRRLEAEGEFAETRNQVLGGSQAAARRAAQRDFPTENRNFYPGSTTLTGLVLRGGLAVLNRLLGAANRAQTERVGRDTAILLTAQREDQRNLAAALYALLQRRERGEQFDEQTQAVLNGLVRAIEPSMLDRVFAALRPEPEEETFGSLAEGSSP